MRREGRQCVFAAKTMRPDPEDWSDAWWALFHEGRLLCSLDHPHVVRGYELFIRLRPVLVMESLTGESLDERLARDGPLPVAEALRLAREVADALAYLHKTPLLHLDLSPDNVMCERGHAKLIDLSIAQRPGPGIVGRGKRAFMAPEQIKGLNLTPATDVWGLGGLLHECLTGEPPFEVRAGRNYEQLERHAPPVASSRSIPPELNVFIYRCLNRTPAERPELAEVRQILAELTA